MTNHDQAAAVWLTVGAIVGFCVAFSFEVWRQARADAAIRFDRDLAQQRTPGMGDFRPATGRPHIAAMQAATETPADAEWRRRLARWTKEAEDAS
jgi:hypothetical protein